jgi:hypothetical protein
MADIGRVRIQSPLVNRWGGGMDIHKPKPWRGWSEFLKEIGTIVIGVLIALGAEQVVEWLHHRDAAGEARAAVRAEVTKNLAEIRIRLATENCVERRLDEIGELLSRTQDGVLKPNPSWVGQPAIVYMASQRWQAASGSGRVSLFDADEQGRYATIYTRTTELGSQEEKEQAAWAQLRGLEDWRGPLGAAGRVSFLQALQQARYSLWSTKATLIMALEAGRSVGISPPVPTDVNALPHSVCLPLDTPRAKAVALLTDATFGQPK